MNSARVDVDDFISEMRAVAEHTTAPAPHARLAAALDAGVPRRPLTAVDSQAPVVSIRERGRQWWRTVIVTGGSIGVVLFGGLAGAGALPAPIQHATASVVSHVGIALPGAVHRAHPGTPASRASTPSRTPAHTGTSTGTSTGTTGPGAQHPATTGTTPATTPTAPVTPPATTPITTPGGPTLTLPPITIPSTPALPKLPTLPTIPGGPRLPGLGHLLPHDTVHHLGDGQLINR